MSKLSYVLTEIGADTVHKKRERSHSLQNGNGFQYNKRQKKIIDNNYKLYSRYFHISQCSHCQYPRRVVVDVECRAICEHNYTQVKQTTNDDT